MAREHLFTVTLKDCRVDTMRSSKGAGGQHRDKTSSAIRITHEPSGAVGQSQDHREQHRNKRLAFQRMAESPKFKLWVREKAMKLESIDTVVERLMDEDNLKPEMRVGGKWVPYSEPLDA